MNAELLQSCPTLCNPMDCSLPASSVHGNSPGSNTGVGCHFRLQDIYIYYIYIIYNMYVYVIYITELQCCTYETNTEF